MSAPLCHYCHQPIDKASDDYVGLDEESDRYDTPQFVAHRTCRVQHLQQEIDRLTAGRGLR